MTEKELINLGFKKETDNSSEQVYHYFTYEVNDLCVFITNASDELVNGGYVVEFFNMSELGEFSDVEAIRLIIKTINQFGERKN